MFSFVWVDFYALVSFSLAFLFLLSASYTDLKKRIVPNSLSYTFLYLALLFNFLFFLLLPEFSFVRPILISFFSTLVILYVLFFIGFLAGGDFKLFLVLSLLSPKNPALFSLNKSLIPMTFTLLLYSLLLAFPYAFFVLLFKTFSDREQRSFLFSEIKKEIKNIFLLSVTYTFILFPFFILLQHLNLHLLLIVLIEVVFFIVLFFIRKFLKNIFVNIVFFVLSLILIVVNPSNFQIFLNFLFSLILISFILSVFMILVKLSRKVFTYEKKISELVEGDILSDFIILRKEGIEIREKPTLPFTGIFKKRKKIEGEVISTLAGGLTKKQLRQIQDLERRGLVPKSLRLRRSMPFVPLVFLSFILSQFIGDFVWLWIFGFF